MTKRELVDLLPMVAGAVFLGSVLYWVTQALHAAIAAAFVH